MKKLFFSLVLLLMITSQTSYGQIINNWTLQKIDSNYIFTEGPYWIDDNHLLFSDINGNAIYKWDPVTGSVPFLNPSGKSNGITGDIYGNIYIAQHSRKISKIDTLGNVTTLAVLYNGDSLNSPNDIVIRSSSGFLYFTDPTYGISPAQQELPYSGVFYIKEPGDSLKLLIDSLAKPNGITFSPDEQRLYVCNSQNSRIYYYEIKTDGTLKPGKLFAKVKASIIDGIKTDFDGNVYVAAHTDGVKIYNPQGQIIDSISVPESVTNLAWGDKFRNTLYITAGSGVYRFHRNPDYPFILTELLGRPTNNSITVNMMAEEDLDIYAEYGTLSGIYTGQTTISSCIANAPAVIMINGLSSNTKYYYRIRYRIQGTTTYLARNEFSFTTQRTAGSTFTFDVQADPHLDAACNYTTYINTMNNTLADHPDFMFDLGDNFMSEKLLPVINFDNIEKRILLLRHFYDKPGSSVPLYLVIGNHEGELGWLRDGTAGSLPVMATMARKLYYPNPEPDAFYTGDTSQQQYVGRRESYYAWMWGDALFVVLDPYWNTMTKPGQTLDCWDWTLGEDQYQWFKSTLENSPAKYKFVFSHQILGGDPQGQGRGGIEYVPFYEMGGKNADSLWGFNDHRPLWPKTIHQLMIDNCVNIFFHGHDHFYGKQTLDSVIYQECPQASLMNYNTTNAAGYGYTNGIILPNSGHLRVTVSDSNVRVEYVRSYHAENPSNGWINGQVSDNYVVNACMPSSINDEIKSEYDCQVYPNPVQSILKIVLPAEETSAATTLINAVGQTILVTKSLLIDATSIPNGFYMLSIKTSRDQYRKKIIINH